MPHGWFKVDHFKASGFCSKFCRDLYVAGKPNPTRLKNEYLISKLKKEKRNA